MLRQAYKWNSTFRIRSEAKNSLSFGQGKRRNGRSRLRANGRRTKAWRAVWRWLKPRLEAAGRVRCEFAFLPHVCEGPLDPVHSKKRRLMRGNDIYAVSIGCRTVHDLLDMKMSHEEMEQAVLRAIDSHGGLILPQ